MVVVLGHGTWRVKDTGRDFESDWVDVFTIKDGSIAAFRDFMDTGAALKAFQCEATPAAPRPATASAPH